MSTPRSIRFEPQVLARLNSYAARHPGMSVSATAAQLVDEGLRMAEHPGIIFRDGPSGRRAVVHGGPDVWEIVRAVSATRAANRAMSDEELLELVVEITGVTRSQLRTALAYRAAYPDEVDAFVAEAERFEEEALTADARNRALLAG